MWLERLGLSDARRQPRLLSEVQLEWDRGVRVSRGKAETDGRVSDSRLRAVSGRRCKHSNALAQRELPDSD